MFYDRLYMSHNAVGKKSEGKLVPMDSDIAPGTAIGTVHRRRFVEK